MLNTILGNAQDGADVAKDAFGAGKWESAKAFANKALVERHNFTEFYERWFRQATGFLFGATQQIFITSWFAWNVGGDGGDNFKSRGNLAKKCRCSSGLAFSITCSICSNDMVGMVKINCNDAEQFVNARYYWVIE